MRAFTKLILAITFLSFSLSSFSQGETYVTTWQNNARAAQVFTLDDFAWTAYLNWNFYNETTPSFFNRHGLVGTFGPSVKNVMSEDGVRRLKHNIGLGNSIANHGWWHLDMRVPRSYDSLYQEIVLSKQWHDSTFAGMQTMDIFMYPYCRGLQPDYDLAHETYYGVRDRCGNSYGYMDAYPTDHFSGFNTTRGSNSNPSEWTATIDSSLKYGGFTMTLTHNWNQTGETDNLNQVCSFIRTKVNEGQLWNTTLRDLMKYGKERDLADITVVTNTASLIEISVTDTFPDSLFYVPITLVTMVPSDWAFAEISQGGNSIGVFEVISDSVMYNVVPDAGLVQLSKVTESLGVTSVDIERDTIWMKTNDLYQLQHQLYPVGATNKTVTWSSDDGSVIVDIYGRMTGVSAGEATITLTSTDGSFTDEVVVYVIDAITVNETSVEILSSITIDIGETQKMYATVLPSNSTLKNTTWVTENFDIATIDNSGNLTGLSVGTTRVLVGTLNHGRYAYCDVTVTSATAIPVSGISVNPTTLDLNTGQSSQITPTVLPVDASNKSITWSSNNTSVATVNSSGLVNAIGDGTATITATTVDGGFTATTTVNVTTVIVAATGVTVSPTSWTLALGASVQLTPTVEPANATNKAVTWSSDNESVAIVNASGLVTSLAEGTATITVTTDDGSFTADSEIDVLASGTTFRYLKFTTYGNDNLSLREAEWMLGATEYPLVNMSSNPQGDLTAFGDGNPLNLYEGTGLHVYVGATTPFENGIDLGDGNGILPTDLVIWAYAWGRADSMVVEGSNDNLSWVELHREMDPFNGDTILTYHFAGVVNIPVTGVSVSPATLSLQPTENSTLTATVEPANASNLIVSWSSDNESAATVDAFGEVTAVADGAATITATTADGSFTDECVVTVSTIAATYALTVNSGTGDGDYEEDEVVNVTADSPPGGQEFDAWTGDVSNVADVNNASTTITMPASVATITATYVDLPTYTLTVNSGTGGGDYLEDEAVNISANAAPGGQEFDAWTGDISNVADVNSASTSITMPASAATITATYVDLPPNTYSLTVNNGTGSGNYLESTVVNITADTPPAGQEFDAWTGDTQYLLSATDSATTVTMPAQAAEITATYKDIDTGNGINDSNIEISMYPNPAHNYVTIVNIASFNELQIINSLGQVMKTNLISNNELTIDISDLDSGIYFVKMSNDSKQDIKKLLIK